MAAKVLRGVWFLSVLISFGALLYAYASMPVELVVGQQDVTLTMVSRETVFYVALTLFAFVNVFVFIIGKFKKTDHDFRAWFYGLIVTLNIFMVISLSFVTIANTGEKYDFSNVGYLIYGSIILFLIWLISWPVYQLFRKI
jgi:hypothetical protein